MAQNVTIAGNQYPSVPSILIPKTGGGGNATFTDTSPTTASASDVAQGKIFFDSTGSQQTGTNSGGGTDFIVTITEDQNGNWSPDCTFADIQAAFTAGKTISTVAYTYQAFEPSPSYGYYEEGDVAFYGLIEIYGNNKVVEHDYGFDSNGFVIYSVSEAYYTYDATALPADVANGKIFYNANGRQTGTASGGGGASNLVTGTFKGTTTGAAMDVTLNYSGSGYPIAVFIFTSEGAYNTSADSEFYRLVQRYAYLIVLCVKNDTSTSPSYSNSTNDKFSCLRRYKSSSSSPTSYSNTASNDNGVCDNSDADASFSNTTSQIKFKNNKKMSVYIASTSYGFAANIEYTYCVLYSS